MLFIVGAIASMAAARQVLFAVVDVCAEHPFEGNPTAVVLLPSNSDSSFPPDDWLVKVRN